ncbi:hypothetical protein LTR78_003099 [Recurvomyces mirabilis]|uniref:RNA 3'-terminal phosphate cyclase domain-containing protein n=1 Tax=Recurvomyces mirabilis TaxID=574656 RepID=A0AAE1C3L4_9PEZI|nr:hypothetical protein LTR78_003099 [Recurvomyces mirabilis]KAK5157079.1 hypothetical protein LTS14_004597 [Recurvomyces mirabilis]
MPRLRHLTLDGRTLEGGGQLLRTAICLSALTSTPLKIHHIRGNRSGGGGLKAQHLASVKWLAEACDAHVEGGEKGSTDLLFEPGQGRGRGKGVVGGDGVPAVFTKKTLPDGDGEKVWEARLEIGTAGSTGLALQAILPFILFTKLPGDARLPVHLTLSGGTNVSGSPSYEYLSQVLLPMLKAIGLPEMKTVLHKRGWSQGGSSVGSLTIEIPTRKNVVLEAFTLAPPDLPFKTQGPLRRPRQMTATFVAPISCHAHLKQVFVPRARELFVTKSDSAINDDDEPLPIAIRCTDSGHEKRLYLIAVLTVPTLTTTTASLDPTSPPTSPTDSILASDWLYDKRIPVNSKTRPHDEVAENMAQRVLTELHQQWRSGAYVDEHLRDQLVIFQALANGRSRVHPGYKAVLPAGTGEGEGEGDGGLREPSLHTQTAEWVVNEMLGAEFDGSGRCEGVGFDGSEGIDWVRKVKEKKRAEDVNGLCRGIDGVNMT